MKINNLLNFNNKVILVTGCSGQLGNDISNFFLKLGSIVYGIDISNNKKIKNSNFFFKKTDISKHKKINLILKQILRDHKKIDIIINNAAKSFFTPFYKRTKREINETIDTNLTGPINIIKEYYKLHKKNPSKRCNIINIGSIYGIVSPNLKIYDSKDRINSEVYGASKAGLIQLTKYFAVALAKENIIVNSISPGGILNNKVQSKKFIRKYSQRVPMEKMGNTFDICLALLYFASDKVKYTTGQNLVIDGGLTSW
tara:strand:+ start:299 stop:1066 length:768 start_codon:yes stop_codon:yes gene_type:complete